MSLLTYPVNDFGPIMKGLVIGGLGIFHVFTAQFAIGGGFLMCYFQWLAGRQAQGSEASRLTRAFLDSYFSFLVLISFVLGALTGVGMWFTSIQISPQTIGLMVDEFHWLWATEWTFFCIEVISGYTFYRYGKRLSDPARLTLLTIYSLAAWMSLFWINGILSWQLTPGNWLITHTVWDGFFNPSFYPSLLYRTVAALAIASLIALVVINSLDTLTREEKAILIHQTSKLLVPMALMPFLGLWYVLVIPADSRSWIMGGSIAMTLFLHLSAGASVIIGAYAILGLARKRLFINGATALLLCVLAFAATAGGEFVREGIRKPFTVRETLYSNAITPDELLELRRVGSTTADPYPLRDAHLYANEQLRLGAKVFRNQCSVCHTMNGVNGIEHLTQSWSIDQKRMNIAKLQRTKAFMPPFAGTPAELEALVQLLEWHGANKPRSWPQSESQETLGKIAAWLDEDKP